jgi:hypothetical protein
MVLLLYKHKGAMLFIYIIVDFTLLTEYKSHNEDIIEYLKAILYQINKTKEVFLLY